jgi:hypothetical protein
MKIDIYAQDPDPTLEYMIEVMHAAFLSLHLSGSTNVQVSGRSEIAWRACPTPSWNWGTFIYRISPEFKPKPKKKRIPLDGTDFSNAPIWVHGPAQPDVHSLVIQVTRYGITTCIDVNNQLAFPRLMDAGWEYSTDRKTWLPCSKEVDDLSGS